MEGILHQLIGILSHDLLSSIWMPNKKTSMFFWSFHFLGFGSQWWSHWNPCNHGIELMCLEWRKCWAGGTFKIKASIPFTEPFHLKIVSDGVDEMKIVSKKEVSQAGKTNIFVQFLLEDHRRSVFSQILGTFPAAMEIFRKQFPRVLGFGESCEDNPWSRFRNSDKMPKDMIFIVVIPLMISDPSGKISWI